MSRFVVIFYATKMLDATISNVIMLTNERTREYLKKDPELMEDMCKVQVTVDSSLPHPISIVLQFVGHLMALETSRIYWKGGLYSVLLCRVLCTQGDTQKYLGQLFLFK